MSNGLELLLQHNTQISYNQNAKVLIEDPLDVDMTFVFKMDKDTSHQESYTKYNVIDNGNAEIIIYNVGIARTVSLKQPIQVGSYKQEYKLYVDFVVYAPNEATSPYVIEISFFTSKE